MPLWHDSMIRVQCQTNGNRSRELRKSERQALGGALHRFYADPMTLITGRCILIAEDDRAVRQSLERTLRLEGFIVTATRTGVEAVDACAAALPDLVILDVMMPDMDGLTACRTLRPRYAELPILMLTARHEVGDRVGVSRPVPMTIS